jgi:hypothetical protein
MLPVDIIMLLRLTVGLAAGDYTTRRRDNGNE